MKTINTLCAVIALLVLCAQVTPAHAALGGKVASAAADKKTLNLGDGVSRSKNGLRYQEMVSNDPSNKFKIRQFNSTSGDIFAVTWSGRIDSQLSTLLGAYAADFNKYQAEHAMTQSHLPYRKIDAGSVVVELWDVRRRVEGKAYAPALMPVNVTADQFNMGN